MEQQDQPVDKVHRLKLPLQPPRLHAEGIGPSVVVPPLLCPGVLLQPLTPHSHTPIHLLLPP